MRDEAIEHIVKFFLNETREKKSDGSRGTFQEIDGFIFFVDIKNSTEAFLEQEDRTYLKFIHTFHAGVYRIFKSHGFLEDSIKFIGDGILGICREKHTDKSPKCPFKEISNDIVKLIKVIIKNLGAKDNNIIEGIRIAIVPTSKYKLYRGKTGAYGDSRIEYNGLAINEAVKLTKMYSVNDYFASMRIVSHP